MRREKADGASLREESVEVAPEPRTERKIFQVGSDVIFPRHRENGIGLTVLGV